MDSFKLRLAKPHRISVALFLLFAGLDLATGIRLFWGLAGLMLGIDIGLIIAGRYYEKMHEVTE